MMTTPHILRRYWVVRAPSSSKIHRSASPGCLKLGTLSGCAVPAGCRGCHGHPGDPAWAPWGSSVGTLGILQGHLGNPAQSLFVQIGKVAALLGEKGCSQPSLWKSCSHTWGKCWGSSAPTHGALTELPPKLVSASHAAPAPAPHLEIAHKALSPHRREEGGRRTSPTSPALPTWWV